MRYLIVNADDFGASPGVNHGIYDAHCRGIVTSTSLMVDGPACEEAALLARLAPRLGLGLHVDLGGWDRTGRTTEALLAELNRQVGRFVEWIGRAPSHVDSHRDILPERRVGNRRGGQSNGQDTDQERGELEQQNFHDQG